MEDGFWFARISDVRQEIKMALEIERGHTFTALGKLLGLETRKLRQRIEQLEREIKALREERSEKKG